MTDTDTRREAPGTTQAAAPLPFRVEPITGALGAEIQGLDISRDLDERTVAALRAALLAHCVIFFRDQDLDVARHKSFASRFGTLFLHPNIAGSASDPAVIDIVRYPGDTKIIGEDWHSDTPQVAMPPMGSLLYAVEAPPHGGDTMFASQYLAHEALSPGMKAMLAGVRALHSDRRVAGPARDLGAARGAKRKSDDEWRETANLHPVVRTHPETGRQGSLAFWDNRCAQHVAINDPMPSCRIMRRLQLHGDTPL